MRKTFSESIQNFVIHILKKNVYGLSLLPSAIISRLFHHQKFRYLGLFFYFLFFSNVDEQYRKFSRVLYHHVKKNGKFYGQQLQEIAAIAFASGESKRADTPFFVDIGAAHPWKYSNTAYLQDLGWSGVLVEPNPYFYDQLARSRSSSDVKLLQVAVGSSSSVSKLLNSGALSTLMWQKQTDMYDSLRKNIASKSEHPLVDVKVITPRTLLVDCIAPIEIDYLSLDTEGNELEILEKFPFESYSVKFITCEHNFEKAYQERLDILMWQKGYQRVMKFWSAQDAWYVKRQLANYKEKI